MYIVTGGAGFIGSVFVGKLNAEGIEDILIVDELGSSSKWLNIKNKFFVDYLHKDHFIELLRADRIPGAHGRDAVKAIIHLGACSTTTETDMDYLLDNNVMFSRSIAVYAAERGIRLIYASSAATYGDGGEGYSDDHEKLKTLKPLNRYGYSKQLFDLWCLRHGLLDRVVGLKYFNVYGPNEYHKDGQFSGAYRSFMQAQETGTIKLFKSENPAYGDGEQRRDFIYVKDCADVMWWLLRNPGVNGIYNLGTGAARTWKDMAKAVFAALQAPEHIEYVDLPENLARQYQYFTEADMSKLRQAGYAAAFTSLEDGVRDYVVNYLNKSDRYY